MSKSKYYWWSDNNYTKKLVTESLSQTANIFYAKKKKNPSVRCSASPQLVHAIAIHSSQILFSFLFPNFFF